MNGIIKDLKLTSMKRHNILASVAAILLVTACSNDSVEETLVDNSNSATNNTAVDFTANMTNRTRATETAFENGDEISVYAVQPVGVSAPLASRGNYADNVKYTYNGTSFSASENPISLPDDDKGLAYYAVYPYSSNAGVNMVFSVQTDQTTHAAYTASDLCTSFHEATTSSTVNLDFTHRLSSIVIQVTGKNIASKNVSIQLSRVMTIANVKLNDNTFEGTGETTRVKMGKKSTDTYEAIIPPQSISAGMELFVVTVNGVNHNLALSNNATFRSGKRYNYTFEITEDDDVVILNGDIDPWNTADPLDNVVPEELQDSIENYMPIYKGDNPPFVEGAYYIDPFVAVYCEDYGYAPGYEVTPATIRFYNQNTTFNTLDYAEYEGNLSSATGSGAFISGSGNNFTAFFNTVGETKGISTKTALVISGTKSSSGIENLYYAFIMVDKGEDPSNKLMEEGVFRIFKDQDGLSVNTTWNASDAKSRKSLVKAFNDKLPSIFERIK